MIEVVHPSFPGCAHTDPGCSLVCRSPSGSRACKRQRDGLSRGRKRHETLRLRVCDIFFSTSVMSQCGKDVFLALCWFSNGLFPLFSVIQFSDCNSISRYLARVAPALGLYGSNTMEQTEVSVSEGYATCCPSLS